MRLLLLLMLLCDPNPPELRLPDRWGNLLDLRDFRGRPTLVAFFAYWCDTWKPLLGDLQKLRSQLGEQAPQVVWVAVDGRQREQTRELMGQLPFPVVTDFNGQTCTRFQVTVVPTLVLLDRQGLIERRYQGYPGSSTLLRHYRGQPINPARTPGYLLQEESELWRRLLKERNQRGLPPLELNTGLTDVAREYVQRLKESGNLNHQSSDGPADRVHRAGLFPNQTGEILLQGPDSAAALEALLDSPTHKQLLLHSHFRRAGLGAIRDGPHWLYCLLLISAD
ncbi:MAG: redoxin domain-containing protein [Vulcanimicrobiota bacterium]